MLKSFVNKNVFPFIISLGTGHSFKLLKYVIMQQWVLHDNSECL